MARDLRQQDGKDARHLPQHVGESEDADGDDVAAHSSGGAHDDAFGQDGNDQDDDDGEDNDEDEDNDADDDDDDDDDDDLRSVSVTSSTYEPGAFSESAEIISKRYMEREQVRMAMEMEERNKRLAKQRYRKQQIEKWQSKTSKSPFRVNLVAENERLDEENRLRMMEEARHARLLAKRAEKAKQEVILKALTESSDLELLRREKRAIIDEEKRLKALMDLEKTNSHRKMDLIAAKNAEKHRRQEREEYRRRQRQLELEQREQRYKQLLKEKLALED
ncbi:hypothetical protein P43SY_000773 [Pythium insidiosum]|uniref:Uncharacterized protein n=1 Tax=Pythium insidiosum TaxID=114742 RepID=A0AAD5Q8A1_PYTIN|nr:hypothetical protein P43SY_000773 [Pythium insidiosum]